MFIEGTPPTQEYVMFTRQHFEAVADTIHANGNVVSIDESFDRGAKWSSGQIANDLADMFAADNPQFDREKFFSACGGVDG